MAQRRWPHRPRPRALAEHDDGRPPPPALRLRQSPHAAARRRRPAEAIPKIYTDKKYQSLFGVPGVIIYPYWIDIMINKNDSNEIISKYVLATTRGGEDLLKNNGIPKIFPGIIHLHTDYTFYYFCGDFADNPTKFRFAKLDGITGLKFLMYNAMDVTDRNRFFWEFYLPMMQTIFKESYSTRLVRK